MGKGRAPCCDKSKVKRGPWSPAEDLKLITFIQKNGHENWRALPKKSGLLRCGKSCRLRWINYLRPDVKRGNFTKEEEENIIKLHETLGNKWSKIASHFPGRTDNEIKNVWNTHLKKRLLKTTDPSVDESKESSAITSSSSSSSGSILSGRKRDSKEAILLEEESGPKRLCNKSTSCAKIVDNNSQEDETDNNCVEREGESNGSGFGTKIEKNPKQQATLSTTTSSNSSYGPNVSNGSSTTTTTTTITAQVDYGAKVGDHEEEMLMDGLLLDFEGPFDVDAILKEVNQPDQAIMMPLLEDNEDSFWDMFGSNSTLCSTLFDSNNHEVQVLENNPHEDSSQNSVFGEEKNSEIANNKDWFKYLESELGLEATMMENDNQIAQAFDRDYHAMINEEVLSQECNFSDLDPKPEFSASTCHLWPSNRPQNSSAF